MKKNYEINFAAKTITITQAFSERAQYPGNEEYSLLITLRKDFPEFKFMISAPKARKRNRKITYDKMVQYISCQKDSTILLKRFTEVRELSKSKSSPYNFVYKWFIVTFPNYNELPKFDENGEIIPQYNLATADYILKEINTNIA